MVMTSHAANENNKSMRTREMLLYTTRTKTRRKFGSCTKTTRQYGFLHKNNKAIRFRADPQGFLHGRLGRTADHWWSKSATFATSVASCSASWNADSGSFLTRWLKPRA